MPIREFWRRQPRLLRILAVRLALIVPQMFGVTLVAFLLIRLLPGDPARLILGNFATDESIALYRQKLGLDKDVWTQFAIYLDNVLHGDLGTSPFTSKPIIEDLADRAPATLELILYAVIFTVGLGILIAVVSVVRRGSAFDWGARAYGFAAGAIPDFWVALLLVFFLYTVLGWAPAPFGRMDLMLAPPPRITGFLTIDALFAGDWEAFRSAAGRLILPVATITIVNAGAVTKMTHSVFSEIWDAPFVAHMRACGVPERQIIRAALRNSLPPIISVSSFILGFLLGAAVLVETIFSWGGLGQYAVQAVINSDYAALQGFVLVASAFILIVYSIADILYEIVDPRIRT
ncbi:ABC transporter permease [Prosthecomicrobium pneumaticum]|uniref:Peptide/nickel transport system permease protein n=1 Tax=Prosthecomicrobium pneumaticum TaxID=81895 RepID=A0A7W9CTC5_9HYPH|nr:ABC transporter permease [Prosthecomicrobium pneumaticum]MBB5751553.1 peptide/nickel transport system permease protein [Prosthecomicrobium pneumaticum]